MKICRLNCAVFFLLATLLPALAQAPAPAKPLTPLLQSLMAREKSLIEAKKKDDAAFFRQTVSDDFSLVGVDGKLLQGSEAVGDLGDSGLLELTPYDMKVVPAGEAASRIEPPQEFANIRVGLLWPGLKRRCGVEAH